MIPLLERPRVEALAAQTHAAFEVVRRARAILALAQGAAPSEVAKGLGWAVRTVQKWRARWEGAPAVDTLQDGDRPGRPAEISMATRCNVVQLACDKPSEELFREKWTQQALAEQIERWTDVDISRSSVQRIGECQRSCRPLDHAAAAQPFISARVSLVGLKRTSWGASQSRVVPVQRSGLARRAFS